MLVLLKGLKMAIRTEENKNDGVISEETRSHKSYMIN